MHRAGDHQVLGMTIVAEGVETAEQQRYRDEMRVRRGTPPAPVLASRSPDLRPCWLVVMLSGCVSTTQAPQEDACLTEFRRTQLQHGNRVGASPRFAIVGSQIKTREEI
jgi:hypothetical protein